MSYSGLLRSSETQICVVIPFCPWQTCELHLKIVGLSVHKEMCIIHIHRQEGFAVRSKPSCVSSIICSQCSKNSRSPWTPHLIFLTLYVPPSALKPALHPSEPQLKTQFWEKMDSNFTLFNNLHPFSCGAFTDPPGPQRLQLSWVRFT